jgi:hypothetical protein
MMKSNSTPLHHTNIFIFPCVLLFVTLVAAQGCTKPTSLRECPDCEHSVSFRASECPNCGAPLTIEVVSNIESKAYISSTKGPNGEALWLMFGLSHPYRDPLGEAEMEAISQLPDLLHLTFGNDVVTSSYSPLIASESLIHLDLNNCRVSRWDLIEISQIPNLMSLNLDGCQFEPSSLEALSNCTTLRCLDISKAPFLLDTKFLIQLSQLSLERIYFTDCQFTNYWKTPFENRFDELRKLSIEFNDITSNVSEQDMENVLTSRIRNGLKSYSWTLSTKETMYVGGSGRNWSKTSNEILFDAQEEKSNWWLWVVLCVVTTLLIGFVIKLRKNKHVATGGDEENSSSNGPDT